MEKFYDDILCILVETNDEDLIDTICMILEDNESVNESYCMNEMAWSSQCGVELTKVKNYYGKIINNPTLTQKIKELIKITNGERGIIYNQKISNAFNFDFEGNDYEMLINIGQSIDSDIDIAPNFGTSHMKDGQHWMSSQNALEKFQESTQKGFLMPSYDINLEEEYNKVWLIYDDNKNKNRNDENYGKYIYVIGLSDGSENSVTILITCFDYKSSYEDYITSDHVKKGIIKATKEQRIKFLP